MLFAGQLWDMAFLGLPEAGHSWAILGNFPGVPAHEDQQLLLRSCLRFSLVAGAVFPILWASLSSVLESVRWK